MIYLGAALAQCGALVVLVEHELFKSISIKEGADNVVDDTRGPWLDQPLSQSAHGLSNTLAISRMQEWSASQ